MIYAKRIFKKQNIFIATILLLIIFVIVFIKSRNFIPYFRNPGINAILITIDSLRADHLSCYGSQRRTSPNIDAFAKSGTLFTQAISLSNWTPPSMSGIATSNYPHIFGNFSEWGSNRDISLVPTLQGILKSKGYFTVFLSSKPHLGLIRGFKHNFDIFNISIEGRDDKLTKYAIDWLNKNRYKPFFLWIHYFGPHGIFTPPPPYDTLFINDDLYKGDRHLPVGKIEHDTWHVIPSNIAVNGITDVDYYISQYDGEIAFTDNQIGILLEEIKRLNLNKNTLIIISADHGQSLGDHGYYFVHENNLYECLINVPLIIMGNGIIPQAKVIKEQISMIDLTPTILDILGINSPKQMRGSSFLSLIRSGKRDYIYYTFSERPCDNTGRGKRAVRGEGWKLIEDVERDTYELYNLKDDPKELNNLAYVEIEKLQFLKHKLDTWTQQTRLVLPDVKKQPLDEKTKEELRSLGYVQ